MQLARRALKLIALVLAIIIGLALLAIAFVFYQGHRAPQGNGEYVALGSSFAAGPGVGEQAPGSPHLCLRSATDYPRLVADALKLGLTDMTCSGATSLHILNGGQFFQPPQLSALRPQTRLVTVTIGGNDLGFLGNIFSWSCQNERARTPFLWRLSVCRGVASTRDVDQAIKALPDRLYKITQEVRRRSPQARLVFVDYVTFLPARGECPDRLPLTGAQLDRARFIEGKLVEITASAARRGGALYVPISRISKGHDICSARPWAFGFQFPKWMFNWAPMPFHPNQQGMDAIAKAVVAATRTSL